MFHLVLNGLDEWEEGLGMGSLLIITYCIGLKAFWLIIYKITHLKRFVFVCKVVF